MVEVGGGQSTSERGDTITTDLIGRKADGSGGMDGLTTYN